MYLFLSVSQRDFISFRENYFVDAVGSEANMGYYTFIRFYDAKKIIDSCKIFPG
jgi:hypothetical protein